VTDQPDMMRLNPACKKKRLGAVTIAKGEAEWPDFYTHRNFGIQANG
jgi:hypothetical protein